MLTKHNNSSTKKIKKKCKTPSENANQKKETLFPTNLSSRNVKIKNIYIYFSRRLFRQDIASEKANPIDISIVHSTVSTDLMGTN